jgi:hypothetical protein
MLNRNMLYGVVKVIKAFFEFLKALDSYQIHNMLALMLDPHFNFSKIIKSFVGCENVIQLTIEYDKKEVIPLRMIIFY